MKATGLLALSFVCGLMISVMDTRALAEEHEQDAPKFGVCVLAATEGSEVNGTITFAQQDGFVHVVGTIHGLTPGLHGFHIHEFGDLRHPKGDSAGGHFNPEGHMHAGPEADMRHAGDLGNIRADANGVAKVDIKAKGLMLHYAFGRSIVVHADADDLQSQPSGNAGPRIAVGVIGIAKAPETR